MTAPLRRCSVCEHPSVLGINQAILNGKSFRSLATDYKIGSEKSGTFKPDHNKVKRHAERCLAVGYQEVQKTNLTVQGLALDERLKFLDAQVDLVIADAAKGEPLMVGDIQEMDEDGNPVWVRTNSHMRTLLGAVREGRHNAHLRAKLAGAMPEEDADALEKARAGMDDPEVRKLLVSLEEKLAAIAQDAGHNALET